MNSIYCECWYFPPGSCLQLTTSLSLTTVSSITDTTATVTTSSEPLTSTTSAGVSTSVLSEISTTSLPVDSIAADLVTTERSTAMPSLPYLTSTVSSAETVLPSRSVPHIALTSAATDASSSATSKTLPTTASVSADVALVTRDVVTERDQLAGEETVNELTTSTSTRPTTTVTVSSSAVPPPSFYPLISPWLFVLVAAFVTLGVLLTSLVFCLVRARSQHKLCWTKHRCYLPVTLLYHNGSDPHAVSFSTAATVPTKVSTELAPLTSV